MIGSQLGVRLVPRSGDDCVDDFMGDVTLAKLRIAGAGSSGRGLHRITLEVRSISERLAKRKNVRFWSGLRVGEIVNLLAEEHGLRCRAEFDDDPSVMNRVQQGESDLAFLSHLLAAGGYWLFDDQDALRVTRDPFSGGRLHKAEDLDDAEWSYTAQACNLRPGIYYRNYLNGQDYGREWREPAGPGSADLLRQAMQSIAQAPTTLLPMMEIDCSDDLDRQLTTLSSLVTGRQLAHHVKLYRPGPSVGDSIALPDRIHGGGVMAVTASGCFYQRDGESTGFFYATCSGQSPESCIPIPSIGRSAVRSLAVPLLVRGIVSANDDPENLGRVRVQMNLDGFKIESDWIRGLTDIATPQGYSRWVPRLADEVVPCKSEWRCPGISLVGISAQFRHADCGGR
ncbi:MAG: phage late control D family protein [bacterium]|nr:phage late control D family protein [bacterium]